MEQAIQPQVLVVDDDPMNVEVMQAMLAQLGIPNDVAMSGSQAIDIIEARIQLYEERQVDMIKIVLLDYSMPDMDGP